MNKSNRVLTPDGRHFVGWKRLRADGFVDGIRGLRAQALPPHEVVAVRD